MKPRAVLLGLFVIALACSTASAHPFHGDASDHGAAHGFLSGFAHPWLGLDHLLAMVAVGLLGVQLGGRALWMLPLAFVGGMILGGAAGIRGGTLPLVEVGIALSVVLLGLALALGRQHALLTAALAIAGCGLFHGHAHGTELAASAIGSLALHAAGLLAATLLLHLAGITAGLALARRQPRPTPFRLSGAAISGVGLCLLVGLLF